MLADAGHGGIIGLVAQRQTCVAEHFHIVVHVDTRLTYRPEGLLTGMNKFLRSLDITFRRDPTNLCVPFFSFFTIVVKYERMQK